MQGVDVKGYRLAGSPPTRLSHAANPLLEEDRFGKAYEASPQSAMGVRGGSMTASGYVPSTGTEARGWTAVMRTERLVVENERLRAREALLLDQLKARNAELAARDTLLASQEAEIRKLRLQLMTVAGEDIEQTIPHRLPDMAVRVRAKRGAVHRGVPFIHPEELSAEIE
jgi:hypothetical protein